MSDETAEPTTKELKRKLEQQVQINIGLENEMIKAGVRPSPFVIASQRLDLLLDFLMDERQRYQYEMASAERVHTILLQILDDIESKNNGLVLPGGGLEVPKLKL